MAQTAKTNPDGIEWHAEQREPEYSSALSEYVNRFIQIFIRSNIFDVPGLSFIRHALYRSMFDVEDRFMVGSKCYFKRPHNIKSPGLHFGDNTTLSANVEIDYSGGVFIGKDVWISQNVLIETHEHVLSHKPKSEWEKRVSSLTIGDDAWIGANVMIMPSVTEIGEGAIIGAGAVVTKNVEPFAVMAGVPAKRIKSRKDYP